MGSTGLAVGVTGKATIGGTLTAAGDVDVSGVLKAPQLRITGTDPNDGIIIHNVDGTEVAKFHSDS